MAAIGKKTKTGGVHHQISGAGFHSPKGYSKSQRRNERGEIDERLTEMEQEAADHYGSTWEELKDIDKIGGSNMPDKYGIGNLR